MIGVYRTDNSLGAGGIIGAEMAASVAPDAYARLFAANQPFTPGAMILGTEAYGPVKDFVRLTKVAID